MLKQPMIGDCASCGGEKTAHSYKGLPQGCTGYRALPMLTDETRQLITALAQLIETALAVDGDAWCAAIDAARTHRPIDNACDALSRLLGEAPARWQSGLGYYPSGGARGLLALAYHRCGIEGRE